MTCPHCRQPVAVINGAVAAHRTVKRYQAVMCPGSGRLAVRKKRRAVGITIG